ncbi:MAG: peptidylprolyl isomerase, partial [Bacteroidota bacterium]|nr:peptidylprolyl isomerase [Bacteroidota bacterium]
KKWAALPINASDSVVGELAHSYNDAGVLPPQMMTPSMFSAYNNSEEIINTKLGDVAVGINEGQIKAMRVIEEQDTGALFYHSKNILIGFGRPENKDSAKAVAQKLYDDLKAGADFATVARRASQDPSARNGGDMRWMGENMYDPAYSAACVKAPLNELQGPLLSARGYHIFEVVAKSRRKIKIQTIPVEIRSSSQTSKMVQQQASIFREKAAKDGFDQAAQAQNLRVTADGPPVVKKGAAPMFGYKPWVNYVFDLSAGDITQPVRIPSARLSVVAQVTEVIPEGVKPLDSLLKEQIKNAVAKRKSIEALAPKAKELRAMLSPGDDLSKLGSVDSLYKPIQVVMGPAESTPALGTEYAVNNAAFTLKPGEISQPIEGENGYYIVKLIELRPADKAQFEAQKTKSFESLNQEKQQRFFGQWLEELKEKATVVDYRSHRM